MTPQTRRTSVPEELVLIQIQGKVLWYWFEFGVDKNEVDKDGVDKDEVDKDEAENHIILGLVTTALQYFRRLYKFFLTTIDRYCALTKRDPVQTLHTISINILYVFFDRLLTI